MPATLTHDQAFDKVAAELIKIGGPDMDLYTPEMMPRISKLTTALKAEVAKAESQEMVSTLLTTLGERVAPAARYLIALTRVTRRFEELTRQDAAIRKALLKMLPSTMRLAVEDLERLRELLRAAKDTMDSAEAWLANASRDADAAAEEWAGEVLNVQAVAAAAMDEGRSFVDWQKQAAAAVAARDAAALVRLQKAEPKRASLDAAQRWNRDTPFAEFFKRYDLAAMPAALRKEIQRDADKALKPFHEARAMAAAATMIANQVAAMAIETIDCRKGLTALELPASALPKLTAAVNGPLAGRAKALEAFAKAMKLKLSGAQVAERLKRAGVI